jgi:predicted nucleic acid-binding protein
MDVCCLNRPFDDLTQDRVYLEAEAVLSIVSHCEKGEWTLLASGILDSEMSRHPNADRLAQVRTLYSAAREWVCLSEAAESRAAFFQKNGVKPFDSLHLALAETTEADVFLTTDDRLLKSANRIGAKVKTANPVSWLMEVMNNER